MLIGVYLFTDYSNEMVCTFENSYTSKSYAIFACNISFHLKFEFCQYVGFPFQLLFQSVIKKSMPISISILN